MSELPQVDQLDAILSVLHKHGVVSFRCGDIVVDMHAPVPQVAVPSVEAVPEASPEEVDSVMCRCGHPYWRHRDPIGCMENCPIWLCEGRNGPEEEA